MPRKENKPELYVRRQGFMAMRVARPYKAVAEWCGGRVVTDGAKFSHIETEYQGEVYRAREGGLILQAVDHNGDVLGYYTPISQTGFASAWRKAEDDELPYYNQK